MISLIISLIFLFILTPIMFNFRNLFPIGIYNVEDDYINSYTDGTAGINLHLNFDHGADERCVINTYIESTSTGNVVNYGLLSIIIYFLREDISS